MRGMIIRGRWMPMNGVIDHYVCRRCHARIGRPYADPVTGELDFNRIVCANEHEITEEGDLVSGLSVQIQEVRGVFDKIEVLHNYGHKEEVSKSLFGDKDFEGFE